MSIVFPITSGSTWWFITCYALLILFLPILINGLQSIGRRGHFTLLAFILPYHTIARYIPGVETHANGPLIDFLVIAILVSYIRWYLTEKSVRDTPLLTSIAIGLLLQVLIIFLSNRVNPQTFIGQMMIKLADGVQSSAAGPALFLIALPVFLLAVKHPTHSSPINYISTYCLSVYLIHDHAFTRTVLWKELFTFENLLPFPLFPISFSLIPFLVFIGCCFVEYIRRVLFSIARSLARSHRE